MGSRITRRTTRGAEVVLAPSDVSNDPDQINAHVDSTANPHGVTAAQAGAADAAHAAQHQNGGADEVSVAGLSGLLADPQTPAAHKASHVSGGSDAFAAGDVLEAAVKRLQESGGAAILAVGAVADGQFLQRSGSNVIGAAPSAVFGSYAEEASDDDESSTSSEQWQNKLSHTTATLPAGKYRLGWQAELANGDSDKPTEARFTVDGTERGWSHYTPKFELDEPGDSDPYSYQTQSGFYYLTLGAPAAVTMEIDYHVTDEGGTAYIKRARIEIWRVG